MKLLDRGIKSLRQFRYCLNNGDIEICTDKGGDATDELFNFMQDLVLENKQLKEKVKQYEERYSY